jgi:hypothetical protein
VTLAANAALFMIPRRFREEAMAPIGHGSRVNLARRYSQVSGDDRLSALSIAWAAGLYDDPSLSRRALLRARHDRVAQDYGEDGAKARHIVDEWFNDVLAPAAYPMGEQS